MERRPDRKGAGEQARTADLLFTKQLLCQLSYAGMDPSGWAPRPESIGTEYAAVNCRSTDGVHG